MFSSILLQFVFEVLTSEVEKLGSMMGHCSTVS